MKYAYVVFAVILAFVLVQCHDNRKQNRSIGGPAGKALASVLIRCDPSTVTSEAHQIGMEQTIMVVCKVQQ